MKGTTRRNIKFNLSHILQIDPLKLIHLFRCTRSQMSCLNCFKTLQVKTKIFKLLYFFSFVLYIVGFVRFVLGFCLKLFHLDILNRKIFHPKTDINNQQNYFFRQQCAILETIILLFFCLFVCCLLFLVPVNNLDCQFFILCNKL